MTRRCRSPPRLARRRFALGGQECRQRLLHRHRAGQSGPRVRLCPVHGRPDRFPDRPGARHSLAPCHPPARVLAHSDVAPAPQDRSRREIRLGAAGARRHRALDGAGSAFRRRGPRTRRARRCRHASSGSVAGLRLRHPLHRRVLRGHGVRGCRVPAPFPPRPRRWPGRTARRSKPWATSYASWPDRCRLGFCEGFWTPVPGACRGLQHGPASETLRICSRRVFVPKPAATFGKLCLGRGQNCCMFRNVQMASVTLKIRRSI